MTLAGIAQPQNSVTLAWDTDPDSGIAGYNVYYGVASRTYTTVVSAGNTGQATINGLTPGATYFFAVTAYDASGQESGYSDEISYTVPAPAPPPTLTMRATPNQQFALGGTVPVGHTYDILASTNFVDWTAIQTFTAAATGAFEFIDPASARYPSRFYRLHEVAAPAPLPTLQLSLPPGQPAVLDGTGQIGHTYDILASPDLVVWTFVANVTIGPSGLFEFIDSAPPFGASRFFLLHETTFTLPGTLPQLRTRAGKGGELLEITGQAGHGYDILGSENLVDWTVIATVNVGLSGSLQYVVTGDGDVFSFYRVQESN